jgi:hypothetical protein
MPASYAVFQFRNVMIRTVSSPDPELFFCDLHNANKKVFYQIFCFLLTEVTFRSDFKDIKLLRSHNSAKKSRRYCTCLLSYLFLGLSEHNLFTNPQPPSTNGLYSNIQ